MVTHVQSPIPGDERAELLAFVEAQRGAVRRAVLGLDEDRAESRPCASELSLAGLVKHLAEVELGWLRLAQQRPNERHRDVAEYRKSFHLEEGETLAGVLDLWSGVARETEDFVHSLPDLNGTFPLPEAPWFPKDGRVSMRWLLVHLVEEVARHAGHADILRESLDGRTALDLTALEGGYAGQN
ncbi:DinB family protein [Streptomyces sp. NPDC002454]